MKKRNNFRKYITTVIDEQKKAKQQYIDKFIYCDYNEVISSKFYKMVDLLLELPFECNEEVGSIILTFVKIEKDDNNKNYSPISNNQESYIQIFINQKTFKLSINYIDICGYKDENIYNIFKEKIKSSYEKRREIMFYEALANISSIFPEIGREFKIDDILA